MAENEGTRVDYNTSQNQNTNPNTNQSNPSLLSSPYFIGANENSGAFLVTQMLDSTNYHSWARSMKRALRIKNKLGFIHGSICVPTSVDNPLIEHWIRCNDNVITWMQNTMSVDIKASTLYAETTN